MTNPIRSYDLALGAGVTLPVREHGDPEGTPLLLLHGYTDSWRSWEPVLPLFPRDIRAIAVTMRGHGDAAKPERGYAPSDFAADAVALLDHLGIGQAHICGHCMGGFVAQRVALDAPDRVTGLVLESSFPTAQGNPVIEDLWENGVAPMTGPVERAFAYDFQAGCVSEPVASGIVDIAADESTKVPVRVWKAALRGLLDADHRAELPRIGAPTLLIWGARDAILTRSEQEVLLDGIPGSRLAVYEKAGHSVHWEEPARFARDVAAFVKAHARREPQPA